MSGEKQIIIIAGPNGAGKTTFAREYLPLMTDCANFVNADLIASGLTPLSPEASAVRAGRMMLKEIADLADRGESFAFESTLSGRSYEKLIPQWQAEGYQAIIMFLRLPTVRMALTRVKGRVSQGGHNVPEDVVRRRFKAGKKNFENIYKSLADAWILFDNSGAKPEILEKRGE